MIPPLRYEVVSQLKQDFPQLVFILNGGLSLHEQIGPVLGDGVMIGRAAYESPWILHEVDARYFGQSTGPSRDEVIERMKRYCTEQVAQGVHLRSITRHMLGLFNGLPGARAWRRKLSDPVLLAENRVSLLDEARAQVCGA